MKPESIATVGVGIGIDRELASIPMPVGQSMISNADSDSDADSDPDNSWRLTAKSRITHSSPERQSLSGSHGQRPWF